MNDGQSVELKLIKLSDPEKKKQRRFIALDKWHIDDACTVGIV